MFLFQAILNRKPMRQMVGTFYVSFRNILLKSELFMKLTIVMNTVYLIKSIKQTFALRSLKATSVYEQQICYLSTRVYPFVLQ
jgi:hypothetical protein